MPPWDPVKDFGATAVADAPVEPAETQVKEPWDPAAEGFHEAGKPTAAVDSSEAQTMGNNWANLYAGLDTLDSRLKPEQQAAFKRLDLLSDNSKAARAQAINQAYVQAMSKDMPHSTIELNWPAIRDATANHLGFSGKDFTDVQLYGHIAGKLTPEKPEGDMPALPGMVTKQGNQWTYEDPITGMGIHAPDFSHARGLKGFWESINIPLMTLAEAPKDLPDLQEMGMSNPAIIGGVYNGLKPLVDGLTSPLSIATLGAGSVLTQAATKFPLAKAALVTMTGAFTGLMGYGTAKSVIKAPEVLRDPNASLQDRVEAVAAPVAEAAATLLGAVGTALAALPTKHAEFIVKEVADKNPAEAAQIFREIAKDPEVLPQSDFLMDAAHELDRIAKVEDKAAVKESVKAEAEAAKVEEEAQLATETKAAEVEAAKPQIVDEPPSEAPVTVKEDGSIGIKNAVVDAELEKMGLPKSTHGESTTFEAELNKAGEILKKDGSAGERLIDELNKEARPVSATEDAILTREINQRRIERDAAESEYLAMEQDGDQAQRMDARVRVQRAAESFQKAAEASTQAGTKNAQALALRRMMLKEDFSLAAMERKATVANEGKPLNNQQQAEVRDLHQRIGTLQKAFDEYRTKANQAEDIARAKEPAPVARETPKKAPPVGRARKFISDQANAARERIKARMAEGRSFSGLDPADLADHAIVGAEIIARGVSDLAAWSTEMVKEFGDGIRPHLDAIFEQAKDAKDQASRLEAYKVRTGKRITELGEKGDANDFAPKERTPLHLDEEANRLQSELDMAKLEFQRKADAYAYQQSSLLSKAGKNVTNAYDAARTLMTTGEFSFILRQGKFGVAANPITAVKALPATFKAFLADPVGAHAINLEVLNHPDMKAARASKLHIIDEGASLNKQEEIMMGRWVGKIPVVHRFNAAGTVFLNRLRFDMWQKMRDGSTNSPEVQKQISTYVNEATGRGSLGKTLEPSAVLLGRAMFAPRYLASRIQYATGHSLWGGTAETRMIIAKQYAKTLVGMAAYYTVLDLALSAGDADPEISGDATDSDFGKVKIGNTRVDPLAGLSQVIVFGARTASAAEKAVERELDPSNKSLDKGPKYSETLMRFARSKMHPVPGSVINLFNGTDLGGNKATVESTAKSYVGPMTYVDIYQALQEQDLPEGVAVSLLAFLGEGLQTYEKKSGKTQYRK